MKKLKALILAAVLGFHSAGFAAVGTFSASGEYLMSDFDTPEIAEEIAVDFARQNAAEQAGIYLKSYSRAEKSELLEDEVKTVASDKIEITEKNISRQILDGGGILLRADIKAVVDTSELDNFLAQEKQTRQQAIQRYQDLQALNVKIKSDIDALQNKILKLKDETKDDNFLVEQERINREFLSKQKLIEINFVLDYRKSNEKLINEAINLNPKNGSAYILRAKNFPVGYSYSEVVKNYSVALILEPQNSEYYSQRGDFYKILPKDYERALEDYNRAINLNENSSRFGLNEIYLFKIKNLDRAIKNYNEIIKLYPQNKWLYLDRARFYAEKNDYASTLKDCNTFIKFEPKDGYGYHRRGCFYKKFKKYNKAITDYNKAIKLGDEDLFLTYMELRDLYEETKEYQRGIENFNKIINNYPQDAEAYRYRADLYNDIKYYSNAEKDYNSFIKLKQKLRAYDYQLRGKFYKKRGNYEKAVEDYTNAINVDVTNYIVYGERGDLYKEFEDYQNALADYESAIKLEPDWRFYYFKRAEIYAELQEYDKAIAEYTRLINLNPNDAQRYYWRAYFYYGLTRYNLTKYKNQSQNYYPQAIADFDRAIELDSADMYYYLGRGNTFEAMLDYDKAIEDYEKALMINPNSDTLKRALEHAVKLQKLEMNHKKRMEELKNKK